MKKGCQHKVHPYFFLLTYFSDPGDSTEQNIPVSEVSGGGGVHGGHIQPTDYMHTLHMTSIYRYDIIVWGYVYLCV